MESITSKSGVQDSAACDLLRLLVKSLVSQEDLTFIFASLQKQTLFPKTKSIKLKNLNLPEEETSDPPEPIDSPLKAQTMSSEYISIWQDSFKSMETLSDSYHFFTNNLINLEQNSQSKTRAPGNALVLGNLELVDISPLVQADPPQNFNQVMGLLEGVDEQGMQLVQKIKEARLSEEKQLFCESCGRDLKSSIFSFFVGFTRLRRRSAVSAETRCARTAWARRPGACRRPSPASRTFASEKSPKRVSASCSPYTSDRSFS